MSFTIFDILIRLRLGKVEIAADFRKAFLQIAIDKNDRDYLRMIWFDNLFTKNPEIKTLRFARLVFGLSSCPFALNGTVKIHLEKFNDEQKRKVIIKLLGDLYAHDVTSSVNDTKEGIKFYETSKSCLLSGKFDLRKWVTNEENLQTFINPKEHSINPRF